MNFNQNKLTKTEWNSIEIPITEREKYICNLILKGFNNVNICVNKSISLMAYLKIGFTEQLDSYIYIKYLQNELFEIYKKYNYKFHKKQNIDNVNIKKADIIRFNNTDKSLNQYKKDIIEFVVIDMIKNLLKYKEKKNTKWLFYYYSISKIIKYSISLFNKNFKIEIELLLNSLSKYVSLKNLIERGEDFIEKNNYIFHYNDDKLYNHQKELFTYCKYPNAKLIQYIAPTGTGKTMSPLGLSEKYRIIFLCAARHVGLSLAKYAISLQKKVAFAFGCNGAEDIRLHYYAAKDYTKNKRTGGIGKVDNSVGDKVEIMISDIKSYLPAMYYMLAFNKRENIILYWDEPTITLDYFEHEFHNIIQKNWQENLIPNIVLSSATLPQFEEMQETISDFKCKFEKSEIYTIVSYDCNKSISLIDKKGFIAMPHCLSNNYDEIIKISKHCEKYKTLIRYIDFNDCIKFILYINSNKYFKSELYSLENNFDSVDSISMGTIKIYYIKLLANILPEYWSKIYNHFKINTKQYYRSNIHIVTDDAHTLTGGPTIFMTNNVDKIARFCLQEANIPNEIIEKLLKIIKYNNNVKNKINILQKSFEDGTAEEDDKEKKMTDGRVAPEMKRILNEIKELEKCIECVQLDFKYVPNTNEHLSRFNKIVNTEIPFASDIDDDIIEKIMLIDDVEDMWKILLMMGIGAFMSHKSDSYIEIMKYLAQEQKLYLIIASSDFIYGTNYQFIHGYISKDMSNMTQEKCIQAMGRIGRNKIQQNYTIRFRDDELIYKLFNEDKNKPEVINMAKLFNNSVNL
tara:strand:+ start:3293 stop:5689 length:2397 start_codon:yes stop_codon:yes gene_type:complete